MARTGRPSKRTPAVERAILDGLSSGRSLKSICRDDGMPSRPSVVRWLRAVPEFRAKYELARDEGLDVLGEELIEIADDGSNDWMERENDNGSKTLVVNTDHIQRSRLRVDARKWYLSKLAPKRYGDRSAVELSGPDGGAVKVESLVDLVKLAAKPDEPKGAS